MPVREMPALGILAMGSEKVTMTSVALLAANDAGDRLTMVASTGARLVNE